MCVKSEDNFLNNKEAKRKNVCLILWTESDFSFGTGLATALFFVENSHYFPINGDLRSQLPPTVFRNVICERGTTNYQRLFTSNRMKLSPNVRRPYLTLYNQVMLRFLTKDCRGCRFVTVFCQIYRTTATEKSYFKKINIILNDNNEL